MDRTSKRALQMHMRARGKIGIRSKVKLNNKADLSAAYTPGVAEISRAIKRSGNNAYKYTGKWNSVAIVTDGSAVLGLGDIGALAALPVMEGKAVLFKKFAGIDAFPICLKTNNVREIIQTVEMISPTYGGINLEDISAPRCFEIEKELKRRLRIPVMHDDQHGTAVVVLGALTNALYIARKELEDVNIVINGAGSAGTAIADLLITSGVRKIILCDKSGIVNANSFKDAHRRRIFARTNAERRKGMLADAMEGADVFIGVSVPDIVSKKMVKAMNDNAIVFAMANPVPEIMPTEAKAAGALIVGTGRSDLPNQINNALGFPGIFRGALDAGAEEINKKMLLAAADALSKVIPKNKLRVGYVIPSPFDGKVVGNIAKAVAENLRIKP